MEEQLFRFRTAMSRDEPAILAIIRQAQARMRAAGSPQWQDGYPAAEHIAADTVRGAGQVVCIGEKGVIAYGAVIYDGEPAYERLEGQWLTRGPYVAVHRLAVADGYTGRGVGSAFLRQVEEEARAKGLCGFRIDTHTDNRSMLRLLERLGFVPCGKVRYESGERLAFEKEL
ncbi:N-acetyltransferase family protein [Alistipes sp.]|uniref:GNAT family N-acetyltransferase n=1 Tax=Alistipes sp. TaxID=1872444 RepID=UPI003AF156A4